MSTQTGLNKSVVRGTGIPNYSNAIEEHQHVYLLRNNQIS